MAFYDGIKLYGKDFDTVGKYMARRKYIKSKEAIKNFFFNSVKTYVRLLSLTDEDFGGIQRDARELFLLINACEWKRKTVNMKITADKYRELVFDGVTTMRAGKRVVSIRTPPCHSLSRYFSVKKVDKIPAEVFVHLEPTSNGDHVFMRNRDQNPYLRVKLNTNDRISKFIEFLHRKWSFGGQMSPVKVTLWPDSTCELGSLSVHQVENSPFVSLSMNKLIRNVEEQRRKAEVVEKGGMKTGVEVNTKSKPVTTVIYPRPFNLTDAVIAQGIDFENVRNAIVAELFAICGRKNPIKLRYQVRSDQPETRSQEPWKVMISLLERGYGECLIKKKDDKTGESQPKKPRKRKRKTIDPALSEPSAPVDSTIVRRETDDFESQLAFLKKMPRKKTKNMSNPTNGNGAPALATATPTLSVVPTVDAVSQDTAESLTKQVFLAPKCTVIPRKSAPVGIPMYERWHKAKKTKVVHVEEQKVECQPSTSQAPPPPPVKRRTAPTDFSDVFVSPTKRLAEVELQRKLTDEFLSSLRTPQDTPNQTPKKSIMQQYFGDELSLSPNSTRHASMMAAGSSGNNPSTSMIDFADLMYKQIQDETNLSATGLDISTTEEVHRHYEDMMSSSQDSHDFILNQFDTRKK